MSAFSTSFPKSILTFVTWLQDRGWLLNALSLQATSPIVTSKIWLNAGEIVSWWGMTLKRSVNNKDWNKLLQSGPVKRANTAIVVGFSPNDFRISVCYAGSKFAHFRRGGRNAASNQLHDTITALFDGPSSHEVLAARLKRVLQREDIGRAFFRDVQKTLLELDLAWFSSKSDTLDQPTRRALSLVLLSRMMFLAFVAQKGWLASDQRYLARLLLDPMQDSLYETRLKPLFFEALNTPIKDRKSKLFEGIPFLNGGLFSPSHLEQKFDVTISDEIIRLVMRQLFEQYHFTEKENESELIAIDPQMLGYVFEALMGDSLRNKSGAFYTPVSLVKETTDEPLRDALTNYVKKQHIIAVEEGIASKQEAQTVISAIDSMRVLDMAVGSGAFLLRVAEQLSKLRSTALRICVDISSEEATLICRKQVVQSCLYGVDIAPTAVLLCELRLWLFIAAATPNYSSGKRYIPDPLPNLDHHIRVGDMLLSSTDFEIIHTISISETHLIARAKALAKYGSVSGTKKSLVSQQLRNTEHAIGVTLLRNHLDRIIRKQQELISLRDLPNLFGNKRLLTLAEEHKLLNLAKRRIAALSALARAEQEGWLPSFNVKIHFSQVLQDGGFDFIVGNPPWVRFSKLDFGYRTRLKARYKSVSNGEKKHRFGSQADLVIPFIERAMELLKPKGFSSLIVPAKLFRSRYGEVIRKMLCRKTKLIRVEDLSSRGIQYFNALTYPARICFQKAHVSENRLLQIESGGKKHQIPATSLYFGEDPSSTWPLLEASTMKILERLQSESTLAELFKARMGIKTEKNKVFLHPPEKIAPVFPLLRGGDLSPLSYRPSGSILFAHDTESGLPLQNVNKLTEAYLQEFKTVLQKRSGAQHGDPLWKVFRVRPESLGHRVAWRDMAQKLEATYLPPVSSGGPVAINTVYLIAVPSERIGRRIAVWLNTFPIRLFAASIAERASQGYHRFMAMTVEKLPLPKELLSESLATHSFDQLVKKRINAPNDLFVQKETDKAAMQFLRLSNKEQNTILQLNT